MKKYKLEDISVGMHIDDPDQLSKIYDTWIIMTKDIDKEGYTIGFIGAEPTEESDKLFKHASRRVSCIQQQWIFRWGHILWGINTYKIDMTTVREYLVHYEDLHVTIEEI